MSCYLNSTQNTKWIFTQQEIANIIKQKYEKGIALLYKVNKEKDSHEIKKNIAGPEQEQLIIKDSCNRIIKICDNYAFTSTLKSHVLAYFKRFYLKKILVDFDVNFTFYAAFYLGFKVCELDVNIKNLKKLFPFFVDKEEEKIPLLLKYEFYLLDVLGYDLHVYCPYKAMKGIIYDLFMSKYDFLNEEKDFIAFQDLIFKDSSKVIDLSYLTNLVFVISYSKIAIYSMIYYSNNILSNKINHDTQADMLLINLSELKHKLDSYIEDFASKHPDSFSQYNDFENELNKNKDINEADLNKSLAKTFKFYETHKDYTKKLDDNRMNYIKKLINFNRTFDSLVLNKTLNANMIIEVKDKVNDEDFIKHKRKTVD